MAVPRKWVAVNAHATNPLAQGVADGLYVGVAGNVALRFDDADADVTIAAPSGGYILGKVSHVRATVTTATGLFALYN